MRFARRLTWIRIGNFWMRIHGSGSASFGCGSETLTYTIDISLQIIKWELTFYIGRITDVVIPLQGLSLRGFSTQPELNLSICTIEGWRSVHLDDSWTPPSPSMISKFWLVDFDISFCQVVSRCCFPTQGGNPPYPVVCCFPTQGKKLPNPRPGAP